MVDGWKWSASRSDHFIPGTRAGRLVWPQSGFGRFRSGEELVILSGNRITALPSFNRSLVILYIDDALASPRNVGKSARAPNFLA